MVIMKPIFIADDMQSWLEQWAELLELEGGEFNGDLKNILAPDERVGIILAVSALFECECIDSQSIE